jgi:hypothetical protein
MLSLARLFLDKDDLRRRMALGQLPGDADTDNSGADNQKITVFLHFSL